jgi:hypothetical protein
MTKEEEMALLIFCMKRGYEQMRRDSDSPVQHMIDEANRLTEGFDQDDLTERAYLAGHSY